ncbi:isoquinoline 1-oxidoreductase beta subunit [Mesorhizobium sp. J18]|uniref:xanthine dehydrogenase family protein molybdopterin-binding subunit n=1 Tax=Mesorhizobium sp. J18 TaxID=935263 RepID=UPI00119A4441|nr:xanthine dehydrogenase family protein molybdopterin-binding subunit [Mesorhizobium sp. J18]TWG91989.1 isoquinoline 1-oxidoreductase beta subunit [Mesorhizobium sp. J18]
MEKSREVESRITRRSVLKGAAFASAGLVIGFSLPQRSFSNSQSVQETFGPNAFLRVARDNSVTIISKHVEHGMGIFTGLATVIAEELDADWSQVKAEPAPADADLFKNLAFGIQSTGGSNSMQNSFLQYRRAGATARAMLVEAAAARWRVASAEISIDKGIVMHEASGRTASFGELVDQAAALPVPEDVPLKDPSRFRLIGRDDGTVKRLDSPAKTNGTALYGIDVKLPGMLVAVVAHPSRFGSTVRSFDDSETRQIPGIVDVVEIPTGVAVLAESFWAALKGREKLRVDWDETAAEKRGTDEIISNHRALLDQPGNVARRDGDVETALARAAKTVTADYSFPILAHAPLEPVACVARLSSDSCEVWSGDANVTPLQMKIAATLGFRPDQVEIHAVFAGGHFGRRNETALEAVEIVKAINGRAPVKLQWTREEELQNSVYMPMYLHRATAGLDDNGNLIAYSHRIVGKSLLLDSPEFAAQFVVNGTDFTSVVGLATTSYDIPNILVESHNAVVAMPAATWRSNYNKTYAIETFLDQVARAAGRDPYELRRSLLARDPREKKIDVLSVPEPVKDHIFAEHPRELRVLELAAQRAGWGEAMGPGRGRGIALAYAYSTPVAQVAEVTVADDGKIKVDRIVCAIDCGVAVNPDVIRAQMEGSIAFTLGSALHSEITMTGGAVDQSNFHDFQVMRIDEMPKVEVHIVPSAAPPTGAGEPGGVPVAAAVANAVFAATGRMYQSLPFGTV